jgi:hypothetical protein
MIDVRVACVAVRVSACVSRRGHVIQLRDSFFIGLNL